MEDESESYKYIVDGLDSAILSCNIIYGHPAITGIQGISLSLNIKMGMLVFT